MMVFCQLNDDFSGSTRVLRNVIDVALANGLPCHIYVSGSAPEGHLSDLAHITTRYWYRKSSNKYLRYLFLVCGQLHLLWVMLKENRGHRDVVVYQNTLLVFGASFYARFTRRRCICHVHEVSLGAAFFGRMMQALAQLGRPHYVFVSAAHQALLNWQISNGTVIYNAVDIDLHAHGRRHTKQFGHPLKVFFIGPPLIKKGYDVFLNLARALEADPRYVFHWVVNCSDHERQFMLAQTNIPTNVTVHPAMRDMSTVYTTADVVMNLSDQHLWVETFGMTIVEAMAFGCIVIAPPVGGPCEIVDHARNGYLLHAHERTALLAVLENLAADPATGQAISDRARQRSESFTFAQFSDTILSIMIKDAS